MRRKMTLWIFLAIMAVGPSALAQGDLFYPPIAYDVGDWPRIVRAADLDNDGDSDLVVANHNSDNVSILWNEGSARYGQPGDMYSVSANGPIFVATGDLTGDGFQEVIAVNDTSGSVSILVNSGERTFVTPATTYEVGTQAKSVAVAHINDDQHLDLVVALRGADSVAILINDGDGSFPGPFSYYHVTGSQPHFVIARDFDGDGDLDLATGNTEPNDVTVTIFHNDGSGSFTVPGNTISIVGKNLGRICGVDIDNDSDQDIVIPIEEDSDICVLCNSGDGTFQAPEYYDGVGDYPRSCAPADYDADGDLDLVIGNLNGGQISVMYNNGDGTFALPTDDYPANSYPTQVACGDLDNDGDIDIVVNNLDDQMLSVLLSKTIPNQTPYTSDGHTIGLWHLDETSGVIADDASDYANDGSVVGSGEWGAGYFDNAFHANGTGHISVPDNPELSGMPELTMECWFKIDSYGDPFWNYLVEKYGSYTLYVVDDDETQAKKLWAKIYTSDGDYIAVSTTQVQLDQWYHVMVTYDGDSLKIFVNGLQEAAEAASGTILETTDPLKIAAKPSGERLHGWIDEVRLSDISRSCGSADFASSDTLGCEPHTACFTDSSTGTIDSVRWDFGDGGTSTEWEPCYEYADCGTYDVTLIVWGPGGSDTLTKADYVEVQCKPTAAFSYSYTSDEIYVNSTVQFTDESTGDPMPASWLWDFGDGDSSTEQSPAHVYTEAGEFVVTLIAENTCGADTTVDTLEVMENEPVDSLIIPSMDVMGCETDWHGVQRLQVKTSVPLYGAAIPIAVPSGVAVESVSTTGCETEGWIMPFDSITTEFVFVVLASGAQPSVEPGLHSILNLHYRLLDTLACGEEGLIHWDTTYSENPDWNLSFVDTAYNTIPAGFDYDRDSTNLSSFMPGDCDGSCSIDIADLVCLVSYMFQSGPDPHYYHAMDVAASGAVDIADLVKLVNWMFSGGASLDCGQPELVPWPLPKPAQQGTAATRFDRGNTQVVYTSPSPLLGIQLELVGTGNGEPVSSLKNDNIEVVHGREGDRIKVGILDMQGAYPIEAGEHVLLEIPGQWEIVSALAADRNFHTIQPSLGRIEPELPREFSLGQNYPNPFNPTTEINFALPTACDVTLEIYNITGQRVTTLVDSYLEAGQHSVLWDASSNASGVYFYRLTAGEFTETKKMMLLK